MPLKVSCPQCNASAYVGDGAAGGRVKCRSCGTVFDVAAPSKRLCAACGTDLSTQKRVKDEQGNYFCHTCWSKHHTGAPIESGTAGEQLGLLASLETHSEAGESQPMGWCKTCGQPFYGNEVKSASGGVCRQCRNATIIRWAVRILGGGAVLAAILIGINYGMKRPAKSDQTSVDQTDQQQTQGGGGTTRPAVEPPRVAADNTGAKEIQQTFAAADLAANNGDYSKLLDILRRRRQVLGAATKGASAFVDEWLEDARVIEQARGLVAKTRYAEAVKLLKERTGARYGDLKVASNALINGELGVAVVEAALASAVVEDRWQMERDQMVEMLRFVAKRDPACVKATVMHAWLVYASPSEELLRLDARPSVLTRNQLLLPIRTSLAGSIPGYEKTEDFEAFQEKLSRHPQVSPALFREIMGPLDYSLALSRKRVEEEYMQWTRFLREPRFILKDRANNTYQMINGFLWKQAARPEGGYEWQLMSPVAGGEPGAQRKWMPMGLSFLRWSGPTVEGDNPFGGNKQLEAMYRRFDRDKPLPIEFPIIEKYGLTAFSSRGVRLEELLDLSMPMCFANFQAIKGGWLAAEDASDKGKALTLDIALAKDFYGAKLAARSIGGEPKLAVPLEPLMAVFERLEPVSLDLFAGEGGAQYFIATALGRGGEGGVAVGRQQRLYMQDNCSLSLQTPGGGSISLSFQGSQFSGAAQRQVVARMLRWIKGDPAWGRVAELRTQLQEMGGSGGKSADDLLVDAIVNDGPDALKRPENWDANRSWELERAKYLGTIQEVRRLFARYPHGFCRNRLVRLKSAGAGSGGANLPELQFLDESGDEAPQFYGASPRAGEQVPELTKLRADAFADFNLPSDMAVPSPAIAEATGLFGSSQAYVLRLVQKLVQDQKDTEAEAIYNRLGMPLPFRSVPLGQYQMIGYAEVIKKGVSLSRGYPHFMLARARKAKLGGDYHLAAALYRELILPPFAFDAFDSTKPLNRDQFEALLNGMAERAVYGQVKMEARLSHAEVLELAGRKPMGAAVRQTAISEWEIAGLPLLEDLRRYSEAYGYAAKQEFNTACRQIRDRISATPRTTIPAPTTQKAATFSAEQAAASRMPEKWLENFYDGLPTMEEYRKAKKWILAANPRLLRRQPRTDAEQFLLFWTPISLRGERLSPLTEREIFDAPEGANKLADAWRVVLYAVETAPAHDFGYPRQVLINFAAAERKAAATMVESGPLSRGALAHSLNAIAAISLACTLDPYLPMGYGPARFEPFVLESAQLELETFVRHRLIAAGLNMAEIEDLVGSVLNVVRTARAAPDDYPERRYYWSEYAPLVDDYRTFLRGGGR